MRLLFLAGLFWLICCLPAFAADRGASFFPAPIGRHESAGALPQWKRILDQAAQEEDFYLQCQKAPQECPSLRIAVWQKFITTLQNVPEKDRILAVNNWFNLLPYRQDNWVYGKKDHWATMVEFLDFSGDCEDFAIAKYLTLKQLGVSPEAMRIAMVYDIYSGTDHAFLVINFEGDELILDNREDTVDRREFARRYKPHFAFNEETVWTYDSPLMVRTMRGNDGESVLAGNR